ncbi:ROK family protein [uncultured Friedmanniella sp.]|uniref:ROK family transcriptional regulator n=1 Tax=uncultured Friedmanniella sp. TaxID=335381 RepID=UPI0035CA3B79
MTPPLPVDAPTPILSEEPSRPSLGMVRQLTDRRVFAALLEAGTLTRAAIAARTGISKPTISESVRRLIEAGVVAEDGPEVGGRGRAGTSCRLRPDAATGLAVSVGPDGVVVDTFDLMGDPIAHVEQPVPPPPLEGRDLAPVLRAAVDSAVARTPGPVRSCAVSVAGPVDRRTGALLPLPHAPFLLGEFAAAEVLHGLAPDVEVDNDVNWAALAEQRDGNAADLDDFVLAYLGAGIGGAVVLGGRVVRGASGLAGELAHVRTAGPAGQSRTLVESFTDWGLMRPGSEAIDVDRVRRLLTSTSAPDRRTGDAIATAVAGALSSVVALLDPQGLLLGGPWGSTPGFLERVAERLDPGDRGLLVRPTALIGAPYRDGVRLRAVAAARQAVADAF